MCGINGDMPVDCLCACGLEKNVVVVVLPFMNILRFDVVLLRHGTHYIHPLPTITPTKVGYVARKEADS